MGKIQPGYFLNFQFLHKNSNFTGFVDCTLNKVLHGNINNGNKGKTSKVKIFQYCESSFHSLEAITVKQKL